MYNQPTDDYAEIVSEFLDSDDPAKDTIINILKIYMQLDEPSKKVINGFIKELHDSYKEGR